MSLTRKIQHFKKLVIPQKKTDVGVPRDKVLSDKSGFFVKEAYKALRTNLIFSLPGKGGKLVLITSSNAGEGKSLSCMNIAISFAETGAKVCVVDCDMRKPNIARLNDAKGTPGLSNVLVNINTLDDVIKPSKYKNLDLVFAGDIPPNPAELLSSQRSKEVFESLSQKYDYVFVDAPPVNIVTDVSLLAGSVNGVILVVRQRCTTKEDLKDAVAQLKFINTRILGIVMNDVETVGKNKYYKKYRYHRYGVYSAYARAYELPEKND